MEVHRPARRDEGSPAPRGRRRRDRRYAGDHGRDRRGPARPGGAGARAILIEAHVALAGAAEGQDNALSEVAVGEEAEFVHVKVTLAGAERAAHLATWMVGLAADASYRAFHLTAATKLARNAMF